MGLFADSRLHPLQNVIACGGGQQTSDSNPAKGPAKSERNTVRAPFARSSPRGAAPFPRKWGVSPLKLDATATSGRTTHATFWNHDARGSFTAHLARFFDGL